MIIPLQNWQRLEFAFSLVSVPFLVVIGIELIKGDRELDWRINEKNLQALNKYVKKSREIDQQPADRMRILLEETLSLLRQKKISNE